MHDVGSRTLEDTLWAAGLQTMYADSGNTYHYVTDGERIYTLATEKSGKLDFEIRNHDSYPKSVAHVFSQHAPSRIRLSAKLLTELWQELGDETERLSYKRELTAGAIVLYHEGHMMREVHRNRRLYTLADCLKIINTWRPHFTFQQLGSMIDRNMSLDMILGLPENVAFDYVMGLYPDVVQG